MPTEIDRATWPRRHHLAFFETFAQPHFCLTTEVDATELRRALDRLEQKPFAALLYATTRACNEEEAFRLRLRWNAEGEARLILHEVVHPSFTAGVGASRAAAPGCDLPLFAYATAPFDLSFETFSARVAAASHAVRQASDLVE